MWTPSIRPNKAGLNVRPSIRPQEVDFNKIWYIRDGMPYGPIQGQDQGHRCLKVAKMSDFKVYHLCRYAIG